MRTILNSLKFFLSNLKIYVRLSPFYLLYLGINPYRIAKVFFKEGSFQGFVYGETPLMVFDMMAKYLNPSEPFVDIGCGRGIGLFYLNLKYNQKTIGIDCIEPFIKKNKKISKFLDVDSISKFYCINLNQEPLVKASSYFIAGTCMEDELLELLVKELLAFCPKYIFSISTDLSEYGLYGYEVFEELIEMPFGETSLYILKNKDLRGF